MRTLMVHSQIVYKSWSNLVRFKSTGSSSSQAWRKWCQKLSWTLSLFSKFYALLKSKFVAVKSCWRKEHTITCVLKICVHLESNNHEYYRTWWSDRGKSLTSLVDMPTWSLKPSITLGHVEKISRQSWRYAFLESENHKYSELVKGIEHNPTKLSIQNHKPQIEHDCQQKSMKEGKHRHLGLQKGIKGNYLSVHSNIAI